jgi:hypothetical protein
LFLLAIWIEIHLLQSISNLCYFGVILTWNICGEPAISLHSHHVSLVQDTTRLLPVTRDPGSKPLGDLSETGLVLALSRYTFLYTYL